MPGAEQAVHLGSQTPKTPSLAQPVGGCYFIMLLTQPPSTLFWYKSRALGAHFEGAVGSGRIHGDMEAVQSCKLGTVTHLSQKCPDVRNSWLAGSCGMSTPAGWGSWE